MLGQYSLGSLALFSLMVFAALLLDLFSHKQNKAVSMRDATLWSFFWIILSLCFAGYVWVSHGSAQGMLFLTGYFLEKSLSVDNLFVFIAIFSSFSIKDELQHRVLYYGILGAIIMRLLFVSLGSAAIALFGNWALTVFGIFVLWTAWKMWQSSKGPGHHTEDYTHHWSVRLLGRIIPIAPHLDGQRFFTRYNAKLAATPLLVCLMTIEVADVMFAFDSVPAIFSIFAGLPEPIDLATQTFLVFTSNIFAILGLRSLYFLLAAANRFLCHLELAVIAILAFIGLKMLAGVFLSFHISPAMNLIIVFGLLGAGILGSYLFPEKEQKE
ncbi:TerC/Alx family metal homeostasis membrane protein [Desulfovibrio cuneatus]|uniref:TerC/Alx family metal homeostasis membrane protein n=1 Tax=Desulfovibrio cuneatus TaxID=159728 RepID=UPI00040D8309|nr:TerC/Alx family metal homeostasis membrane protein [Desulfovibrio cuneatus]